MISRFFLVLLILASSLARAEDFDSAGVKIHYLIEGKGEPVILIHGLMASAAINWQWPGILAALAKNHRVIALDCRGHGLSDKPLGGDQYGTNMVGDVVRLLDHLSIQKADVVGYSMGGMITLKLIVLHPERVRSAVLGGMGWMQNGDLFPNLDKEGKDQNYVEDCMKGFKGLAVSAEEVRRIKTPFLVIIGENDPIKQTFVEPLHQLRPDVPVRVVRGADHLNCVGQPDFLADLQVFLNGEAKKMDVN